MKKNYYKNSLARKRTKIVQRIAVCFKIIAGIAIVAAMSIIFILCHDYLTQCDYFTTTNLTVEGTNKLSYKQTIKQAQINKGMNIFSINLSTIRKNLLAHPWIAEAEVRRELPNIINIRICEHKPLAIINLGRKFLINNHGEIFKEKTASDPDNLPIITGLEFSDINVSAEPGSIYFNAVMDVLRLGQKSESIIPNKLIKKIQVDREIGITLYAFDRGKSIKLGYNNFSKKYNHLKNVLYYINKQHIFQDFESIDLNNINRIVINPIRIESPAIDHTEV
ncbi:MAG: FtsQ-type POTRA domain-containing protein [Deltaproteobacteria bacterium]|nr:FtsQ-type POTRA domain-containing protein [Deltaproteobacteria bacterium]MBW2661712.1 FtsQ-type POTRA domain-containing protein [Deltaproteobacteria bacterium]